MSSLFSRIVAGEIPCHKVWEDDAHLAFLDIAPVQAGHTLVIPKEETSYLFDMAPGDQAALWEAVRHVEAKVRAATGATRVVLQVVGYEVPHVHVHLIPTKDLDDCPMPPRDADAAEGLEAMAARIRNA